MTIHEIADRRFISRLLETERGRAYLLHQLADAEGGEGGELSVFDHLLEYVEDEKLLTLIARHKEDEERHEVMFRQRAEAIGVPKEEVPRELKLLLRLNDEVGVMDRPVKNDEDVLNAYLLLLVVEERAISQFAVMRECFEAIGDTETAAVLAEVEQDEIRHLRYCHAITKRYATSEEARLTAIAEMRAREAQVYMKSGIDLMNLALDREYVRGSVRRFFWRQVGKIGRRSRQTPVLAVQRMPPHVAAALAA